MVSQRIIPSARICAIDWKCRFKPAYILFHSVGRHVELSKGDPWPIRVYRILDAALGNPPSDMTAHRYLILETKQCSTAVISAHNVNTSRILCEKSKASTVLVSAYYCDQIRSLQFSVRLRDYTLDPLQQHYGCVKHVRCRLLLVSITSDTLYYPPQSLHSRLPPPWVTGTIDSVFGITSTWSQTTIILDLQFMPNLSGPVNTVECRRKT